MQVTPSTFTIAEYCEQMNEKKIIVNKGYQRSSKVWPPAARSFLIETILLGYPMPKLALFQKTDLHSRQTIKEIVDGQQRSDAILSFFKNELKISKGQFSGKKYSELEEDEKQRFISYQLSLDLFVNATDENIREVFRRINSYNIPLNNQERRHATYQGDFKWFMVNVTKIYSQALKDIGVFSESQLSRMNDSVLFCEIINTFIEGVYSSSEKKIDLLYDNFDRNFNDEELYLNRINHIFEWVFKWSSIHNTDLMKPYNFYSLATAISHQLSPIEKLKELYQAEAKAKFDEEIVLSNLSSLTQALSDETPPEKFQSFVHACSAATNRLAPRTERFKTFCKALEPTLL